MRACIPLRRAVAAAFALAIATSSVRADFSFDVSLNTTPLGPVAASGPFSIDFALTNGRTAGNNTVTIGAFTYGAGGGPSGAPSFVGGASGSLAGGVVLRDSAFFNDFSQGFTPGGRLTFHVTMTTNVDTFTPDGFTFSILDGTGLPLPTTDPSGADALLAVSITGPAPTVRTFGSDPNNPFPGPGSTFALAAPTVTFASAVPEPASLTILGVGLLASAGLRRRKAAGSI